MALRLLAIARPSTALLVGCQSEFDGLSSLLVVRSTAFRRALGLRSKARLKPGLRTPHLHLDRALVFICVWKVGTEWLRPVAGKPLWEFIEQCPGRTPHGRADRCVGRDPERRCRLVPLYVQSHTN